LKAFPFALQIKSPKIFAKYNVEVVVGGSVALMPYMQPRMSTDLDINIKMERDMDELELRQSMAKICEENGMAFNNCSVTTTPPKISPNRTPGMAICSVKIDELPVDIFVKRDTPVYDKIFQEAKLMDGLKFAPPECIIFFKMSVLDNKSERYFEDMDDILQVLKINPGFPTAFIRESLVDLCGEDSYRVRNVWELSDLFDIYSMNMWSR